MNGTAKITDEMTMQRLRMVEQLREHYKIADERVLDAMATIAATSVCFRSNKIAGI